MLGADMPDRVGGIRLAIEIDDTHRHPDVRLEAADELVVGERVAGHQDHDVAVSRVLQAEIHRAGAPGLRGHPRVGHGAEPRSLGGHRAGVVRRNRGEAVVPAGVGGRPDGRDSVATQRHEGAGDRRPRRVGHHPGDRRDLLRGLERDAHDKAGERCGRQKDGSASADHRDLPGARDDARSTLEPPDQGGSVLGTIYRPLRPLGSMAEVHPRGIDTASEDVLACALSATPMRRHRESAEQ